MRGIPHRESGDGLNFGLIGPEVLSGLNSTVRVSVGRFPPFSRDRSGRQNVDAISRVGRAVISTWLKIAAAEWLSHYP